MSTTLKSRWADDNDDDPEVEAQRKHEKEKKKHAKATKQRKLEVKDSAQEQQQQEDENTFNGEAERPAKRRRLSEDAGMPVEAEPKRAICLRFPAPEWGPCRHVDNFEKLNHIEEGSYGWVSRAKDIVTGEIVALKKLKMENSPDGFPVTGLREIQMLMEARHHNIVHLREVVVGDKMDE